MPGECFNGPMTEIDKQVVLEANPSLDQAAVTLGVKNEKVSNVLSKSYCFEKVVSRC